MASSSSSIKVADIKSSSSNAIPAIKKGDECDGTDTCMCWSCRSHGHDFGHCSCIPVRDDRHNTNHTRILENLEEIIKKENVKLVEAQELLEDDSAIKGSLYNLRWLQRAHAWHSKQVVLDKYHAECVKHDKESEDQYHESTWVLRRATERANDAEIRFANLRASVELLGEDEPYHYARLMERFDDAELEYSRQKEADAQQLRADGGEEAAEWSEKWEGAKYREELAQKALRTAAAVQLAASLQNVREWKQSEVRRQWESDMQEADVAAAEARVTRIAADDFVVEATRARQAAEALETALKERAKMTAHQRNVQDREREEALEEEDDWDDWDEEEERQKRDEYNRMLAVEQLEEEREAAAAAALVNDESLARLRALAEADQPSYFRRRWGVRSLPETEPMPEPEEDEEAMEVLRKWWEEEEDDEVVERRVRNETLAASRHWTMEDEVASPVYMHYRNEANELVAVIDFYESKMTAAQKAWLDHVDELEELDSIINKTPEQIARLKMLDEKTLEIREAWKKEAAQVEE